MQAVEVYVLIREDQNQHGYIDTGIEAVYRSEADALAEMERQQAAARAGGERIHGDEANWDEGDWNESDWEVCWMIQRTQMY